MEHEEIQNIIDDPFLFSTEREIENRNGSNFESGADRAATDLETNILPVEKDRAEDFENEVKHKSVTTTVSIRPTAFAKVEKSLASLGFFTPSSRRIKNQKVKRVGFTREIDGKRVEVSAEIHPSAMFGLPVTADQDKYLALQKLITNTMQSEGKISNPIRFKSSELLRLLNTSTKNGNNYKAISEWLDVMSATTIFSDGAVYVAGQKRFARDRFRVFDRAVSFGKEMDDGTVADANYVWLSAWQLENINKNFLIPIDLETYRELKNHIAKALVPLLQIWLFASHRAEAFEKRYTELCEMLTLQTYRAPSQIVRQFKPSLDELTHHGYIERWRIEKTSDRKAYKIIFFHGPKFHRDRRRRLEQKNRVEPTIVVSEFENEEPMLPEPGKTELATRPAAGNVETAKAMPNETLDMKGALVDDLSAHGLMPSAVLKLFEQLPADRLEKIPDYIEYWDSARKESNVGPGLLYDLIKNGDPLPASFETSRQRADRVSAEERLKNLERVQTKLKADYEEHTREAINRFIDALPAGDFHSRVATYLAQTADQSEFWRSRPELAAQFARHAVIAEISKEVEVPSYEEFCKRGSPRILGDVEAPAADRGLEVPTPTPELNPLPNTPNSPTNDFHQEVGVPPVQPENSPPEALYESIEPSVHQ